MKKFLTLLWLSISAFGFKATAQTTPGCNPEFAVQYITNYTVKFNPVIANDSPYVRHYWSFGDGTTGSQQISPTHRYAVAGTYHVVHTIVRVTPNNTPVCTESLTKQVTITAPCNLLVDFSWTVTQTNPLRIEFHNLSTPLSNTDSITWTFGDGTSSTAVNPVHNYTTAGTYTVCLRVKKNNAGSTVPCVRESCKTIVVNNAACNLVANFSWTVTQTNPLRIEFQNLSTPLATTDSITWTFGDGSSSNQVNPVHIYNAPGTYNVCLRVKKLTAPGAAPCVREICKTVVVNAPCNMLPDFTWTVSASNPLRIEFHNTSTNTAPTDSIRWTFGDGSSSNQLNPVHTYNVPGTYMVCLIITRYYSNTTTPCIREICKAVVIPPVCTLVVGFNSQPDSTQPLRFRFTNTSSPVAATDSLFWTFGDGTFLSGVQANPAVANPTHTYANAGVYNVCLRVKKNSGTVNTPCSREFCKTLVVQEPCTLVVNFTAQPDPAHPLRIKFTNTSTPVNASDSVRWTFGDGSSVGGLQSDPNIANPTHNYANAGNYTVCLLVKKNSNSQTPFQCVREKCANIVVTSPCNFIVKFSWRLDSLNPRKVYFTNLSTPPTAGAIAVWSFGDGSSATSWNAVHEYAQPGRYMVCLKIYLGQNSNCVREFCDTVFIPTPAPPCTQLSRFHFERAANDNQKYKFTPDYINTALHYTWTFGDGSGSQDIIATHRYTQPGIYVACLTAWRGPDCASTTCHEIRVEAQVNCDSAHASFNYQRDPQVPNKIKFTASATLPIIDQTWTITRAGGTVSTPAVVLHQNDPVYLFQDTGYFRVCLRAVLLGGCIREYCNYVRIEQVANVCELQAFPNPASVNVNVNLYLTQPETIQVYVYNSLNVLVMDKVQQGLTGNNLVTLNVNNLVAGQYTIKLVYGNRVCFARFQKL